MVWVMVLECFIFKGLYWYLEQVMVVGHGTAKPCCFCLNTRYWGCSATKSKSNKVADAEDRRVLDTVPEKVKAEHKKWHTNTFKTATDHEWVRPHDVQKEHDRTMQFEDIKDGKDPKVRICSMHKVFPAQGGNPEKMAVKCVSFGVNKKECFGLLGHNGAGKTTLLNMLTGLYPATSGTAFVDDLRLDRDLAQIYQKMGVCPQHDILWGSLTGKMHVAFFGRLKGMKGKVLDDMVKQTLKSVNLTQAGDRKADGYSGGMKRRLSVANALAGSGISRCGTVGLVAHIGLDRSGGLHWVSGESLTYSRVADSDDGPTATYQLYAEGSTGTVGDWYDNPRSLEIGYTCEAR
jgi:ABC-type multidrug transport system ATPase subunit